MAAVPEDPYYVRLRHLRKERGLSRPSLYRLTETVGLDTLVALERKPKADDSGVTRDRARYPSPETIVEIAQALDVSPDEFPEYRLAMARRALDERAPGNSLESALETLAVFELGQRVHADQQLGKPLTDLQREQGAQDFEADVEEAVQRRRGHLRSVGEDEPSEDGQETRP